MKVGIIEIGSRAVRTLVAHFSPDGRSHTEPTAAPFIHDIKIDSIEPRKVAAMLEAVVSFQKDIDQRECERRRTYGTALVRVLKGAQKYSIPDWIDKLEPDEEAKCAWAAGFLSSQARGIGGRCTIFDQGSGSAELISANWSDHGITDPVIDSIDEFSAQRLTARYKKSSKAFLAELQHTFNSYAGRLKLHAANGPRSELILMGSAATKLAFNIKHKRNDDDDYRRDVVDSTELTQDDVLRYYTKIWSVEQSDPGTARRAVDRRNTRSDEYEMVMSSGLTLYNLARWLRHSHITVSANGTRHGMGFLLSRDLYND
jgi:exopolyphosphatase/pppGpp-phosphohydrolase